MEARSGVLRSTPGLSPSREGTASSGDAGVRLGEWQLGAEIGRGAMGIVYRARRERDGAVAAVKVLSPRLAKDERLVERFEREEIALATLHHPRIVRVLDRGVCNGLPWFAMELVDGLNLRQRIRAHKLDDAQLAHAVFGVCQGLQYAHAHGILHRDIKPENILVDQSGEARVGDFGLARLFGDRWLDVSRLSTSGAAAGTPFYMSPEMLKGADVDGRSDLYSIGVVLYEALTGELPIGRFRSPREVRPDIDRRLDGLVMRLLDPDPARRPGSAEEVASVLVEFLATPFGMEESPPRMAEAEQARLVRDMETRRNILDRRRKSNAVALRSIPFFVGACLAAGYGDAVSCAVCFGGGVFVLLCAVLFCPRYTGDQCPRCHGSKVRKVRVESVYHPSALECTDCHELFKPRDPKMRPFPQWFRRRREGPRA